MAGIYLRLSSVCKLVIMKYKFVYACNHLPKEKQGVTLFAGVSGVPPCCMSPNGDLNFISIPSQKSSLLTLPCYKYSITFVCSISRNLKWRSYIFSFCTILK